MKGIVFSIFIILTLSSGTVNVRDVVKAQIAEKTGMDARIEAIFENQSLYSTSSGNIMIYTAVHNKRAYCFYDTDAPSSLRVKIDRDTGETLHPSRYRLVKESLFNPALMFEYFEFRDRFMQAAAADADNLYEALYPDTPHPGADYSKIDPDSVSEWRKVSSFISRYDYPLWEKVRGEVLGVIKKRFEDDRKKR